MSPTNAALASLDSAARELARNVPLSPVNPEKQAPRWHELVRAATQLGSRPQCPEETLGDFLDSMNRA